MYALVDCNNFYASCERLFRPELRGKPIVVLSNNDGCVVARSDEAKAAGVEMGVPLFEIRELVKKANIHVFSSNYALYGDLSGRVVDVLREHAPRLEVYSIDESFVDVAGIPDLRTWGLQVRERILKEVGIPVCVGIARTRTLAKAANRVAKKFKERTAGVHLMDTPELETKALRWLEVEDIWGVGAATARKLKRHGAQTAHEFSALPLPWVRQTLGVVGARIWQELRGVPCQDLCEIEPQRKSIRTSRSFETTLTGLDSVEEAIATFASRTAEKLRERKLNASGLSIFLHSNPFNGDPRFVESRAGGFAVSTNDTREVVALALRLARDLYRDGFRFKKAGVEAVGLVPQNIVQGNMFDVVDREELARLQSAIEVLSRRWGKDTVSLAIQGTRPSWSLRREHLSKRYTTSWTDILEIDMDFRHRSGCTSVSQSNIIVAQQIKSPMPTGPSHQMVRCKTQATA